MIDNIWTMKKHMLRRVRRCKSGCSIMRVAPAFKFGE